MMYARHLPTDRRTLHCVHVDIDEATERGRARETGRCFIVYLPIPARARPVPQIVRYVAPQIRAMCVT